MTVLKSQRKESKFQVVENYYSMRRYVTNEILKDFRYSYDKNTKKLLRSLGVKDEDEIEKESARTWYEKKQRQVLENDAWFLDNLRNRVIDQLVEIGNCITLANSIMPEYVSELEERRLYQDKAIGGCVNLKTLLQYVVESLYVDVNIYTYATRYIDEEIRLIKGWRKSDNRRRKGLEEKAIKSKNEAAKAVAAGKTSSSLKERVKKQHNSGTISNNSVDNKPLEDSFSHRRNLDLDLPDFVLETVNVQVVSQ